MFSLSCRYVCVCVARSPLHCLVSDFLLPKIQAWLFMLNVTFKIAPLANKITVTGCVADLQVRVS